MGGQNIGWGLFVYGLVALFGGLITKAVVEANYGVIWGVVALVLFLGVLLATAVVGVKSKGLAFFGFVYDLFQQMTEDNGKASSGKKPSGAKYPRPPHKMNAKFIYAVGNVCEFKGCGVQTGLQVHHIHDHAKGGSNKLTNLLVVCRNHHHLAGTRSFSKALQQEYARRPNRFGKTSTFQEEWKAGVLDKERAAKKKEQEESVGLSW